MTVPATPPPLPVTHAHRGGDCCPLLGKRMRPCQRSSGSRAPCRTGRSPGCSGCALGGHAGMPRHTCLRGGTTVCCDHDTLPLLATFAGMCLIRACTRATSYSARMGLRCALCTQLGIVLFSVLHLAHHPAVWFCIWGGTIGYHSGASDFPHPPTPSHIVAWAHDHPRQSVQGSCTAVPCIGAGQDEALPPSPIVQGDARSHTTGHAWSTEMCTAW